MDEHAPYAYTPPGGHQLPPIDTPPRPRSSTAVKWALAVVVAAVLIAGAALGVHDLNNSNGPGNGNAALTGSGFDTVIQQEDTAVTAVDCPNVPNRAGYIFDCTVTVTGLTTPMIARVTLNDTRGHFVWALTAQTAAPGGMGTEQAIIGP